MIYNHTQNNGNRDVTIADSGVMKMSVDKRYLMLTLYSGTVMLKRLKKEALGQTRISARYKSFWGTGNID
jgi:lipopolysaccharide export system permease protein